MQSIIYNLIYLNEQLYLDPKGTDCFLLNKKANKKEYLGNKIERRTKKNLLNSDHNRLSFINAHETYELRVQIKINIYRRHRKR